VQQGVPPFHVPFIGLIHNFVELHLVHDSLARLPGSFLDLDSPPEDAFFWLPRGAYHHEAGADLVLPAAVFHWHRRPPLETLPLPLVHPCIFLKPDVVRTDKVLIRVL